MKRIQEKIKDLVEVRPYQSLQNFFTSAPETLNAYHFTDATAELMAKWLDSVSEVQPQNGAAKALAGYRGVGKSHFLATLGAIAAQPELRSRIGDMHVSSSAQRLKRRKHIVAYVQRGTADTILEEIKHAVSKAFEFDAAGLSDSINEILNFASEQAGEVPFLLLVDTAQERESRVVRDDGVILGEIADTAKNLNIFVAVALDDDIAGADGVNSSIARNYTIDYLDQEHLYRIVDLHLFPKQRQRQAVLHEVYANLREVLPSFRWSEQRFASLYPLHPIVLEIAPFIRLYAPDFVFLGFAAETGGRNTGRPANSLIALDEVFDRVENNLRKSEMLKEAFITFDKINSEVIGQIPIMQRLQAKMILKALTLLSLDSDGTTATEIAAAMLIYDENEPQRAIDTIEGILQSFAAKFQDEIRCQLEPGRETRYGLKISTKDGLNDELAELAKAVDAAAIQKVLRRAARETFSDWTFSHEAEQSAFETSECSLIWRGGARRGRLVWTWGNTPDADYYSPENALKAADQWDWEVIIKEPGSDISHELRANEHLPTVVWMPAELNPEEIEAIQRYSALLNTTSLTENFGEQVRAAGHAHAALVKKIWKRIFLEDGKLLIDGNERGFRRDSHQFESLNEMFSIMLAQFFDQRFPSHPHFEGNLGMNEVSSLVVELFSDKNQASAEVIELARKFALPLGLVAQHGAGYALENAENIARLDWSARIIQLISHNETTPLKSIYKELKNAPLGLVKEAQHLVLAAMVANRQLEFVTANGDRIGRRSLDLKIIWDDIIGVAPPKAIVKNGAELTNWANLLCPGNEFRSIEDDLANIRAALAFWQTNWQESRFWERFEALPNEILNNRIWKLATRTYKSFGAAATAIEGINSEALSIDEGLQRVSDAFSNSPNEFFIASRNLGELQAFIAGAGRFTEIWEYLSLAEQTKDDAIEAARAKLIAIRQNYKYELNNEIEAAWTEFLQGYSDHFAREHDIFMRSHEIIEKFEEFLQSHDWWEFENLSRIPLFYQSHWQKAEKLRRQFVEMDCNFDAREMLKGKPFCACSFRLSNKEDWENISQKLIATAEEGRKSYRHTIRMLTQILIPMLQEYASKEPEAEFAEQSRKLAALLAKGDDLPDLNDTQLRIMEKMLNSLPGSSILQTKAPEIASFLNREELRQNYTQWLDRLPGEPILLKV